VTPATTVVTEFLVVVSLERSGFKLQEESVILKILLAVELQVMQTVAFRQYRQGKRALSRNQPCLQLKHLLYSEHILELPALDLHVQIHFFIRYKNSK
jgi:hypothetical protein